MKNMNRGVKGRAVTFASESGEWTVVDAGTITLKVARRFSTGRVRTRFVSRDRVKFVRHDYKAVMAETIKRCANATPEARGPERW